MRRIPVMVALMVAIVLGAGLPARAETTTTNPFSYVSSGLVDYSPNSKPYEGFYSATLKTGCPKASEVDAIVASAKDVGLNATVGDRNGRIEGRVRTQDEGSKAKPFAKLLDSPGCRAYASDAVVSGVLAQYPQRPDAPTFAAPTPVSADVMRHDFSGTSSVGPFGGTVLEADAGTVTNLMAIRVSNPQPGELDGLVNALAPTVLYGAEVASVAGPSAKQFTDLSSWSATADAAFLNALKAAFADAAAQPMPRTTAPVYPQGCDDAFDGFVYSGQKSALGGSAVQGAGGQVQIRLTPQVFASTADAKKYASYFSDATTCLQSIFSANAVGQAVQPLTRTPSSGLSKKAGECAVLYSANLGSPPVVTRVFAVHVVPGAPRAVTVSAQFGGTPAAQAALPTLCSMLATAYTK
jgi:hypothetical protein